MLIKQNGFQIPVPKKRSKMIILTGNDPFLMDYFKRILKQSLLMEPEQTSLYRFDIPKPHAFDDALTAMQHRDIFAPYIIIDIHYDKNQIDKAGKAFLDACLENKNPDCVIIFQAPLLSDKKLGSIANHDDTILLHIKTPTIPIVERWITDQLKSAGFRLSSHIPKLILQYTQGNLLASAQAIDKIKLCFNPQKALDIDDVKPLLNDQAIYQLYELRDACLGGNLENALNILAYLLQNREEPVLILWTLTQEIRQLLQLYDTQSSGKTMQEAFHHMKIWRMQEPLYRKALSRLKYTALLSMLEQALHLDNMIKTSQTGRVNMAFEQLIAALCRGNHGGYLKDYEYSI